MKLIRSSFALGFLALSFTACSEVREDLGLGRAVPDEFTVVDRPPLSMPPDFGLRPPQPGAPRPQEVDMGQHANDVLFGSSNNLNKPQAAVGGTGQSASERALLASTGADKANPEIRNVINHEAAEKIGAPKHLVDELLWWKEDKPTATTVDASAEAARIKAAQEKGQPINSGATPTIERDKSGWLGL